MYSPTWLFLVPGGFLALVGVGLVVWLLPGPRPVGDTTFDVHTMVFGLLFALLGSQILSVGLFAKVFSYSERFDTSSRSLDRALRRVKLEQGLVIGAFLIVVGFAGDAAEFWRWRSGGFGPFSGLRPVIFWSMWLFLGVQVFFSSFFLSMLGISRDTYIGEYDAPS
jgi:uncharacterized membrane protein YidH (DUF202 family)